MNGYLKQSTAGQVRTIGPFVDDTDFKTLENALTINNTDIVISINGGADTTKTSGGATAHGAGGIYTLTWDATDTATVGELYFSVKVSGALVVFGTYVVLEEAVYDALFAASAAGYQVPIWSSAGATVNLSATTVATITTYTGNTPQTGDSFARIGAAGAGLTDLGGMSTTMKAQVEAEVDDALGAGTGTSLTAIPWNAAWDAEVQSEVNDGLVAYNAASTTNITAGTITTVSGNVNGSVNSVTSGVTVTTNNDKTDYVLTSAYDFAKGTTAMTEAYAANGAPPTPVQAIFAIHQYLMQFGISTTNYTVKKLDNTTTAFVVTLDDATTPSAAART